MIYESRLKERQKLGNYHSSSIVITIVSSFKATHLYTKKLRFGGIFKVIGRYEEAGPRSICPIYYRIDHNWLEKYGEKLAKYTICARSHKLEEHKYSVNSCEIGYEKIC